MRPEEIQVRTIMVPDNDLLHWRNMMTLQGAIVRGETEVLFHNCPEIPIEYWGKVRHNHRRLNQRYNFYYRNARPKNLPQHVDDAAARRGIDDVQWKGLRFEFIKVLAAGGHGYVSLWRVWFEDGSSKKVVIKRALGRDFDVGRESRFHLRYAGAEHTSQILDLHAEAMKIQDEVRQRNPLVRLRYRNGSDFNAGSLQLIVFEFMEHGDLHKVLTLASQMDVQFPDRTLWGIWECLVRGVASVAYVPSFLAMHRDFDKELQTAIDTNRLEHFLAQLENIQQSHDVHLDLEELNVLAGTAGSHPHNPIFKLHDLGAFSYIMSEKWKTWGDSRYWKMRKPCKLHRVTPEQVHQDWDQLRTDEGVSLDGSQFAGEDLTQGHPIAGRFGTWTNIFFIGKVMEAAITFLTEAYPFDAYHFDSMDGTQSGNTYGWVLQDPSFSHVDPTLRDLIMRCQLEVPGERPSITALLREIAIRKMHPFYQGPEEMAYFWECFFGPKTPEPIPDPIDDDVADALEESMAGGIIPFLHPDPGSEPHRHEQQADSAPAEGLEYFQKWMDRQSRASGASGDRDQTPQPPVGGHQQPVPGQGQHQIPRRPANLRVPQRIARRPVGDQPSAAAAAPSWLNPPSLETAAMDDDEAAQEDAGGSYTNLRCARAEPDGSVSESSSDKSPVPTARRGIRFDLPKSGAGRGNAKKTGSIYDRSKMRFPDRKERGSKVNKRVSEPSTRSLKTCVKMNNLDKFVQAAMDDMPMAIRNLMARTKHLEQRLADGNLPAFAYITAGGKGDFDV
ncbi:Protein kinase domain-containing protein [Fusarium sp. Ph1]|nr:Protein kinase domain-containing protein [Fusarium sp. Ph1]